MSFKSYFKETGKYILRNDFFIKKDLQLVNKLYGFSPAELNNYKESRFLKIFRNAYDNTSFYHKFYNDHGIKISDINSLEDIKKLPIITKDILRKHARDMISIPRYKALAAHTSGTTGTPLTIYRDLKEIRLVRAYTVYYRKLAGFVNGQPIVSLRGNLSKSQTSMKVGISNTLYLSSYNINDDSIQTYYDLIMKFFPRAIEGYPSSLFQLATLLRQHNLNLSIPITFTSSETLLSYQREQIERQLNTKIYDLYGMTEDAISIEENIDHSGYHEAPGFSINEYDDDGTICTSLVNMSCPLIRYRINDVIDYRGLDENGNAIISGIYGRNEDFILCKDGSKVMRLDFIFKGVNNIKYAQLIQDENGLLHVKIVPELDFSDSDKSQIVDKLNSRVGENNIDFKIDIVSEDNIIWSQGERRKFKFIINNYRLT